MVWVIAFGELFFGDLWCVVWGYGGMRTHFSLLNPQNHEHPPGIHRDSALCARFSHCVTGQSFSPVHLRGGAAYGFHCAAQLARADWAA